MFYICPTSWGKKTNNKIEVANFINVYIEDVVGSFSLRIVALDNVVLNILIKIKRGDLLLVHLSETSLLDQD